jgi:hypothetical protein
MTVSVISDDDDEEAKRFAFSLSFVMTCSMSYGMQRAVFDQGSARCTSPVRVNGSSFCPVHDTPGHRATTACADNGLICG